MRADEKWRAALPNGAVLTYPWSQSQTPDGRVLENNGVVPDIEVALDRASLLQGRDTQLEAAIEYTAEQIIKQSYECLT